MAEKNMKIMDFAELSFSEAELDKLGRELTAVLSTMAYIANEISVFQGLFLLASVPESADDIVSARAHIQINAIARVMNSKAYEAIEQIPRFRSRLERSNVASGVLDLFDSLAERLELRKFGVGFELSKFLRDKVINHYLPSETLENLNTIDVPTERRSYHHAMMGNTFHPIGESVVFLGAVERWAKDKQFTTNEALDCWMRWGLASSSAITSGLDEFLIKIMQEIFPEKYLRQRKPFVDVDLAVNLSVVRLPLFHQP